MLLLIFSLQSCSIDNGIVERIGGDITGFHSQNGTFRMYGNGSEQRVIEIRRDTTISDITLKLVAVDNEERYFSFGDTWIYERIDLSGAYYDIPFTSSVLVDGAVIDKNEEGAGYTYVFQMTVDSISSAEALGGIIENVYFTTVTRSLASEADSFSDTYSLALSNRNGIVGLSDGSGWFFLDSIIQ